MVKKLKDNENWLKKDITVTISPLTILMIIASILIYSYNREDFSNKEDICDISASRDEEQNQYQWISAPEYKENSQEKNYIYLDNGAFVYKHIYMDDFEQEFNVQPLYYTVIDPVIVPYLERHNLTSRLNATTHIDRNFIEDIFKRSEKSSSFIKYAEDLKERIARGDGNIDDGNVYIRWVNDIVGYGMFAGKDFEKDDVLGVYSGVVTLNVDDFEYAWEFNYIVDVLNEQNEKMVGLCIDARTRGNYMRFANHRDSNQNGNQLYVICDELWCVFYTAQTSIKAHEQIFVNYGEAYWKDKQKYEFQ